MKLNRKWINEEFVDLSQVSDREFVETMTLAGQKVETYARLDAEIQNVVVGRVLSMVRHPNSGPYVDLPGGCGKRRAGPDCHRSAKCAGRGPGSGGAAQRPPSRRRPHHQK